MMEYTDVKNAQWFSKKNKVIDCDVKFEAFDGYIRFSAWELDIEDHGRKIYGELVEGKWGPIKEK